MTPRDHRRQWLVIAWPRGAAAKRALAGLKVDLGQVIAAIDAGQSLPVVVQQVLRAIAVAMLP